MAASAEAATVTADWLNCVGILSYTWVFILTRQFTAALVVSFGSSLVRSVGSAGRSGDQQFA